MYGDTIGYRGIWGAQSHPDAVGYGVASATALAADPGLLCAGLRTITLPPEASIGPGIDPSIEADFAGVAMTPPAGHAIGEYIRNPTGGNGGPRFSNLPGDFEVPSGAFSANGSIYVFYTTVVSPDDTTMKGSYLARWAAPSTTAIPAYDILYGVDQRFDANGPLGGDFINIAAATAGEHVYGFGTGPYRASPVHLARKRLDSLATPGFERFDAASGTWTTARTGAAPIIATIGYGETSVRYFASLDRWMFLAQEETASSNHIVARFADRPEGPWSEPTIVHDLADPAFRAAHCCAAIDQCAGTQFMHCDRTGFYGAYLLPEVVHANGAFTVSYTLSSFDPYNVALFSATFR
ncbi:MAG: DUF4185 domain-containing protein [Deltaproteobacteria bacterium]|nr:DUF4185 domain-containing protein [Deltaproteobacteria bacterium]MDQ3299344.1 DUF4185 domain-containing protein [Myxococcota bacterium]